VPTKELLVIGGPNGAGKSTFVASYLAERPMAYLCADLIATEFSHLDPVSRQVAAGREFLRRIETQLTTGGDFIIESTLSGRTLRNFLVRANAAGFSITVAFVFLDSADTCVVRVRERVRRGGHSVPEADVRRRFARSCSNFWHIYREIADQWTMFYNAGDGLVEVAFGIPSEFTVSDDELFDHFQKMVED
jgi:predicted ABC-type ATPase